MFTEAPASVRFGSSADRWHDVDRQSLRGCNAFLDQNARWRGRRDKHGLRRKYAKDHDRGPARHRDQTEGAAPAAIGGGATDTIVSLLGVTSAVDTASA